MSEAHQRYNQSDKGKERNRRYEDSEAGRERARAYRKSEEYKAANRERMRRKRAEKKAQKDQDPP